MNMLIFKIFKSIGTTEEKYQSALQCARGSVVSVLDNEELTVEVSGNTILIAHIDPNQSIDMTPSTCKKKIKGCFCVSPKKLYPEFMKIELQLKAPNE